MYKRIEQCFAAHIIHNCQQYEKLTVKPELHGCGNAEHCHRSNDQLLLSQPKFKSLKTLGDRAFISAAPNLWNSLPNDIRSAKTVDHFKKLVKTHLFKIAFN